VLDRCAEREAKRMPALDKVQLKRARDFIHAHYSDDFDLAALASAAGASKSAICHGLRETVGVPALELRSLVRAAQAGRMLASGIAVSEGALAAGYCAQTQLTRHFRARWGITPARYARTLQLKYA
jgi:AraC-like DNA-binding protein